MIATPEQLKRIAQDWAHIAGEPVELEQVKSTLYAFGSEIATLRLFRAMPNNNQGHSQNLGRFYFSVELQ